MQMAVANRSFDPASAAGMEDDVCIHSEQGTLAKAAFPVMEEIRRMGKLCDVTINVSIWTCGLCLGFDCRNCTNRVNAVSTFPG